MIFITGRGKRSIEDHFDKAYELEAELARKGRTDLLEQVWSTTPVNIRCVYVRQHSPLGLGHAVLCARQVIGNEPFAMLLADDLMQAGASGVPVLRQMVELHQRQHASVLAVQEVSREETSSYGIVSSTPLGRSPAARASPAWSRSRNLRGCAVDAGGRRPLPAERARSSSTWPTSSRAPMARSSSPTRSPTADAP